jgi:hypothetical protein
MAASIAACAVLAPAAAHAHDYPTVDRVVYVQSCMRDHPGPAFEMLNKCACVIDAIAQKLPYPDYVDLLTAFNAATIGGERGSYIRDVEGLQKDVRRFRALQNEAKKGCFIQLEQR